MQTATAVLKCEQFRIREATRDDIASIVRIYNHEVRQGVSNYESREHTLEERERWLELLLEKNYPVLVAESDGVVCGFGSLSPFNPITGYRFTVTGALYIDAKRRGLGAGRALVESLIQAASRRGYHSIVVAVSAKNSASLSLLQSAGFQRAGYFKEIGKKNNEWFDDVGLQIVL